MDKRESIILKDLSEGYPEAQKYITDTFREYNVSGAMISETLLVFEALCYMIFEQRENPDRDVTVSAFRRMGDSSVEITFYGGRFYPDPKDPSEPTPEESILRAYADKIDYSYRGGRNRVTITTKRSHLSTVGVYAASIVLALLVCVLLAYFGSEKTIMFVGNKFVFPVERLFVNAALMVGGPVTFLSMLKHLTDTYIIAESSSNARRLNRNTLTSSLISVVLAAVTSWLLTMLLFSNSPFAGEYPRGAVDMDPENLIPMLLPSDIFAPFQTVMPYSLILLAMLTTYAFCSVGKFFDRMKDAIDAAYVLFARMLAVVLYFLPVGAFCAVMDELLSDGFEAIPYVLGMLAATFASLIVLLGYYTVRLIIRGVRPLPYFKKMIPLIRENAMIASAFDAVPYNIRYCTRAYGYDRKRLEHTMPVLAQINLDGNCFLITVIAMLYIAINSTPLSLTDIIVVGLLVLLLSLGAPNQPGSCLIGLSIVMIFLQAEALATVAIIGEVFFGGLMNLVNITGDIVTLATEEVYESGSAEKLNKALSE